MKTLEVMVRCPSCERVVTIKIKLIKVGKYRARFEAVCPKCGKDFLKGGGK